MLKLGASEGSEDGLLVSVGRLDGCGEGLPETDG